MGDVDDGMVRRWSMRLPGPSGARHEAPGTKRHQFAGLRRSTAFVAFAKTRAPG